MSEAEGTSEPMKRFTDTCKHVFWSASDDDLQKEMEDDEYTEIEDEKTQTDDKLTRSGDGSEDDTPPTNTIEPGIRPPHWYERIEEMVKQNRQRSIENRTILGEVNIRTVWIARILVATLATVLGGLILQYIIIP